MFIEFEYMFVVNVVLVPTISVPAEEPKVKAEEKRCSENRVDYFQFRIIVDGIVVGLLNAHHHHHTHH